jgi:hypothetical protein
MANGDSASMGRCNERRAKPVAPAFILRCLLLTSFTLAHTRCLPLLLLLVVAAAAACGGSGCSRKHAPP